MPILRHNPAVKQALDRANERSMQLPLYPTSQALAQEYPGIDMKGKYSFIDVKLSNDLLEIRRAAGRKPPQVQEALERMITASVPLKESMMQSSAMYRQADIAQQLSDTPALFNDMKAQILRRSDVTDYSKFIYAAKCLTGLEKPNPKDKSLQKFCKDTLKCPLDAKALQMGQDGSINIPPKLEIHFENMNSTVEFLHYSSPAVLRSDSPARVPLEEGMYTAKIDRLMPRYVSATMNRELQLFDSFDKMEIHSPSEENSILRFNQVLDDPSAVEAPDFRINREDLISINGISLREITDFKFKDTDPLHVTPEQRREFQNSILSESLLKQEQVECYIPDYKNKTLNTEPVKMTMEGVEPKKLEPPIMNGWQRYWSKHGHYKELAAKAAKYESTVKNQANMKARIERYAGEISNTWNMDRANASLNYIDQSERNLDKLSTTLYGQDFTDKREGVHQGTTFRMQRSGINLAICELVNRGLSADTIMGSDKLIDNTKADAGKKLSEMAKRDNPEEFVALVLPAMKKIMDLPNIDMDYSNPQDLAKHSEEIYVRGAVFDMWQEITLGGGVMEDGKVREGSGDVLKKVLGEEEADRFSDRASNYGIFYRKLNDYARSSASGAPGHDLDNGKRMDLISNAMVMEQLFKEHDGDLRLGGNPADLFSRDTMETLKNSAIMSVVSLTEPQQEQVMSAVVSGRPIAQVSGPVRAGEIADFQIIAAKPAPAPVMGR